MDVFKRLLKGLAMFAGIIVAAIIVSLIGTLLIICIMGVIVFFWTLLGLPQPDFSSALLVFGLPAVLVYAWRLGGKK